MNNSVNPNWDDEPTIDIRKLIEEINEEILKNTGLPVYSTAIPKWLKEKYERACNRHRDNGTECSEG